MNNKLKVVVFTAAGLLILIIFCGALFAAACGLDQAALAKSVESFPDHSRIPDSNHKDSL